MFFTTRGASFLRIPLITSKTISEVSRCSLESIKRRDTLLGTCGLVPVFSSSAGSPYSQQVSSSTASSTVTRQGMVSPQQLEDAVKAIVPVLSAKQSKGQCGKIATIGGSREYTGAPFFAAISALKVGADLSHVFCPQGAATVIKGYSPELIVHPYLVETSDFPGDLDEGTKAEAVKKAVDAIGHWLERFDAVIIGPGLGRDELVHDTVVEIFKRLRDMKMPVVVDADGLYITTKNLDLVRGNPNCIMTPNKNEFQRLATQLNVEIEGKEAGSALWEIAQHLDGPTLVQKGAVDGICDGKVTAFCDTRGSNRRAGGQGDILSGTIATLLAWTETLEARGGSLDALGAPRTVVAAYGACVVNRAAARAAFKVRRRSMVAGDVIQELGEALEKTFGHEDDYKDL